VPERPLALAALVAFALLALVGVILVQQGPESTSRLGLFFGVVGAGVAATAAALKSEQAANRLNGSLDRRIREAVRLAMAERRFDDPTLEDPEPIELEDHGPPIPGG